MSVEQRLAALEERLERLEPERERLDRRALLVKGGAVIAGAAALTAGAGSAAEAGTGDPVYLGISNDTGQTTRVTKSGAFNPNPIFLVSDLGVGEVSAYDASLAGWGKDQTGVYAYSYSSRALIAWGNQDSAVPLYLHPKDAVPGSGDHQTGELVLLTDGSLVTCVGQGTGTNAKWARIGYNPINPVRIVDTRAGTGAPKAALGPAGEIAVTIGGVAGIPTAARAVVVTLTGTQPSASTYLTLFPNGIADPGTSNLNLVRGQTLATEATVKIGTSGKIKARNAFGTTHVVLDAVGYFV